VNVTFNLFRDRQRQLRKWQKQFGKQQEQQKKVSVKLMLEYITYHLVLTAVHSISAWFSGMMWDVTWLPAALIS